MATTCHQHVLYAIFVVTMVTMNDVIAVDVTTIGTTSSERNLTLVLLTPLDGNLGFEQNAAATTVALQRAQADGFLSGMHITYGKVFLSVIYFNTEL